LSQFEPLVKKKTDKAYPAKGEKRSQMPVEIEPQPRPNMPGKGLLIVLVVFVGAISLAAIISARPWGRVNPPPAPTSENNLGGVEYCEARAGFLELFGFGQRAALDTRSRFVKGLTLHELDQNANVIRSYQHPSWTTAGYVGGLQPDKDGNLYLIPIPFIGVQDNPPEKANIVYRVDGASGVMSPLVDLPTLAPATSQSVFGLLNLAYDCDTDSLYASSVFGSTLDTVAGRIFQIDPNTGEVKSALDGIDAYGIGVFNAVEGKRLYFGLARAPEIYSVGLDESGGFTDRIRLELSLANLAARPDEVAQSITFQGSDRMFIRTSEFDFNLSAATQTQQTLLAYGYNAQDDIWELVESQVISE
jgi:hypothetical protein